MDCPSKVVSEANKIPVVTSSASATKSVASTSRTGVARNCLRALATRQYSEASIDVVTNML